MLILALDTTTRAGSVALLRSAEILYEHSGDPNLTHGQRLPGDLDLGPDQAAARHDFTAAFARFAGAPTVLVARDMRPSGPELTAAFAEGVTGQGVDVVDLGLASTDLLYYAAGSFDAPGAMFTASHNPAPDNGIRIALGADTRRIPGLVLASSMDQDGGKPDADPEKLHREQDDNLSRDPERRR
mgnify:CR=1 FL=1